MKIKTFEFVKLAMDQIGQDLQGGKGGAWAIAIIVGIYTLLIVIASFGEIKKLNNIALIAMQIIKLLFSCVTVITIGMIFTTASEIIKINPNILSAQFYIEIIIVAILYPIMEAWIVASFWVEPIDDDTEEALNEQILKNIAIIILIVVCIFTRAENWILQFGFVIFGKTIGEWVFSAYLSWICSLIMMFFSELCQLPFAVLFGGPLRYLKE